MMASLALMLGACGSPMGGIKIPPPELEYGWSPKLKMEIDGEMRAVKCLTVKDKRKLDVYIEFRNAVEEVAQ